MKRHDKLQDLSREHYAALKLALSAKRAAISGSPAEIGETGTACARAFAKELEPHFQIEETTWLPALRQAGELALVARTELDHAELRRLATGLAQTDAEMLLAFADCLTAHVRFEERELFQAIEALLKEA